MDIKDIAMAVSLFDLVKSLKMHEDVTQEKGNTFVDNSSGVIADIQADHYSEFDSRIDKLALCCQAMWELIQQNTNLTENDLSRKVMEIDMRDGVNDQHMAPQAKKCPRCDSMISVKFQRCLFCGYVDHETSPLKSI